MEATYPPPPSEANQNDIDCRKLPAYDSDDLEQAETNFKDELTKWYR